MATQTQTQIGGSMSLLEIQQTSLTNGLTALYHEGVLCDVDLEADDVLINAHKCVLAAGSPYFKAMFTFESDKLEKSIRIHSVAGPVLNDIVNFLYTGRINVNEENVQDLISAAHLLQVEPLMDFCSKYMSDALCLNNCLEVLKFADFLTLVSLKEAAESFVVDNFLSLYQSKEFCLLELHTLRRILKSDDLNVTKEENVFDMVLNWLKHDLENRKKDLLQLLFCVRFPLLSLGYIENVICAEDFILGNQQASYLVNEMVALHIAAGKPETSCAFNTTSRLGMFQKVMLIFSGGSLTINERAFSCIDLDTYKCYHSIEPHPSFDFKCKLVLYKLLVTPKNEIFCIGGVLYKDYHFEERSAEASDAVFRYNQKDKVWSHQSPLPTGKCGFASCCYQGRIYVFGGYQFYPSGPPTDQTLYYDIEMNKWGRCQDMPHKAAFQAAVSFGKKAYLFGGMNELECQSWVWEFLYETNQWNVINTHIPSPISEASAIKHGNKIFLLGGSDRNNYVSKVAIFEPNTTARQKWKFGADFPEHRKLLSIAGVGHSILVCGGLKNTHSRGNVSLRAMMTESKDLWRYDIDADVWSKDILNLEYGNCYECCVASVNIKYLIPGKDKPLWYTQTDR